MISDRTRILCLAAVVSVIGGCGGGGGGGSSGDVAAELAAADGAADGIEAGDPSSSSEVAGTTGTSSGVATGVPVISSAQMDSFVNNPLVSVIPIELDGGTAMVASSDFITNPLMN